MGLPCALRRSRFYRSSIGKWHRPNVYLHLLMHHLWKMLELFPVPLGLLSEQGSEAKNKVFRYDRDHHAQQHDPLANIKDVGLRSHHRADICIQAASSTLFGSRTTHRHPQVDQSVRALFADPEAVLPIPDINYFVPEEPSEGGDA